MKNLRIGIAGYSGSGKSIVSKALALAGFYLIDADSRAKEFLQQNAKVFRELQTHYPICINSNASINFKVLAEHVLASRESLLAYNALVHPPLCTYFTELLAETPGLCALDAALIPLWHIEPLFDTCVWVRAPRELRCQRIMDRTGLPQAEVMQRIALQESLFLEPTGVPYKILDNQSSATDFTDRVHAWMASLSIS